MAYIKSKSLPLERRQTLLEIKSLCHSSGDKDLKKIANAYFNVPKTSLQALSAHFTNCEALAPNYDKFVEKVALICATQMQNSKGLRLSALCLIYQSKNK